MRPIDTSLNPYDDRGARRLLRRVGAALTATVMVWGGSGLALAATPTSQRTDAAPLAQAAPVQEVGRFPRYLTAEETATWFPTWTVVRDNQRRLPGIPHLHTAARRMYQFYDLTKAGPAGSRIGMVVRDLDTLQILSSFLLPAGITNDNVLVPPNPPSDQLSRLSPAPARGPLLHTFDTARKRFLIANQILTPAKFEQVLIVIDEAQLEAGKGAKAAEMGSAARKVKIGLQGADVLGHQLVGSDGQVDLPTLGDPRATHVGGQDLRGLQVIDGKIYLVKGFEAVGQPEANERVQVLQLNPESLRIEWSRFVRSCEGPSPEDTFQAVAGWVPLVKTATDLYVPCTIGRNAAVVQVPLASIEDPGGAETAFRGNGNPGGFLADAAGGRIHIRTKTSSNQSLLSFDIPHLAYVGQHALTTGGGVIFEAEGIGIDSRTGRVYGLADAAHQLGDDPDNPEALAFVEGRTTPIEPPKRFPFVQPSNPDHRWPVLPRDEVTGRLLIPSPEPPIDQDVILLEDVAPAIQGEKPDPDLGTKNVNEHMGRTGANTSTETSAYGLRSLLVRGVAGLVSARFYDAAGQPSAPNNPRFDPCQADTRQLTVARVREVRLQGALQTALATPLESDPGTITDLQRPSRCTFPPKIPGLGTLSNIPDDVQTAVCQTASDSANAAIEDLVGVAPWLPDVLDSLVSDDVDGPLYQPDPDHPGTQNLVVPPPCSTARDELDERGGRTWPFETASCQPGGPPVTTRPGTSLADPTDVTGDPDTFVNDPEQLAPNPERLLLGDFSATAECQTRTSGSATANAQLPSLSTVLSASPQDLPPAADALPKVVVGQTNSATSYVLDPARGLVARAEAVVRGIDIQVPGADGKPAISIQIDGVYSLAESAAKGRPGTSGTTHHRIIWGIHAAGNGQRFDRGVCADEACLKQFSDGMNRILGDRGRVRVPTPEPSLAAGSPRGFTAAIQMEEFQAINRSVVDGDSAKEVPVFDLIFFNDSVFAGKQRQVFQFAGVKTNSQYGIFCLGGGSVQGKECVLPELDGGAITVSLTDDLGAPLSGAQFTASGAEQASCTTGADGRCSMLDVKPGSYTVTEAKAPEGYAAAVPLTVQVVSNSAASAQFVNFRNAAFIEISLSDAATNAPLQGGVFQVARDGAPFATCTTDGAGLCPLTHAESKAPNEVPLGQYTVQQVGAPKGYQPITDPVSVSLDQPGQVAKLPYTNGTGATAPDADVEGGFLGPSTLTPIADSDDGSGLLGGLFDAFGDLGQWVRRNPGEALMFATSMALFAAPFWASWRRRLLLGLPRRPGI